MKLTNRVRLVLETKSYRPSNGANGDQDNNNGPENLEKLLVASFHTIMVANFNKKQKTSPWHKLAWGAGAVGLLLLAAILVVADLHMEQKKKELAVQVSNLQHQINQLDTSNQGLQQGIANSNNPQYIEKVAREQLNLQQPGEQVVSFVQQPTASQPPSGKPKTGWSQWLSSVGAAWQSFFGKL